MKNNTLTQELREAKKDIFKALYFGFGFDFEKDFNIIKLTGSFTHNKIKKAIGKDFENSNVCLVINNVKYRENYNYFVPVYISNFGLSLINRIPWNIRHDSFYSVGIFEDVRKHDENINVYVIWQSKNYTVKPVIHELNKKDRLTYVSHIKLGEYKGSREGISTITVKDRLTGCKHDIKISSFESNNVNYFIDKSGYFLQEKRNDLKQAAKALRAERLKNSVDCVDFSEDIETIKKCFQVAKNTILTMFNTSNNYETLSKVSIKLRKLEWIALDIEKFVNAVNNKSFSSVDRANDLKESIFNKLAEI